MKLIEQARCDEMAIRHAELPLLQDLISGKIRGFPNEFLPPRVSALIQLERFEVAAETADAVEIFLDDLEDDLMYRRHLFLALSHCSRRKPIKLSVSTRGLCSPGRKNFPSKPGCASLSKSRR